MFDFVKKRALMLCLAGTAMFGLASCDDEDENYDDLFPDMEEISNSLSGRIMGRDGSALAGAVVKMGDLTTQTDDEGMYTFEEVQPGEYLLQAESEGRLSVSETLKVNDSDLSQALVWNAVLAKDVQEKVLVSSTENQEVNLELETPSDVPQDLLSIQAVIPANAVRSSEKAEVTFTPFCGTYDFQTRGSSSEVFWGVEVNSADSKSAFEEPILLQYQLDEYLVDHVQAKKLVDGKWVPAETRREGNLLSILVDEPTTYGILPGLESTETTIQEPVELSRSVWDNLYGKKTIRVKNVEYTYKVGAEVTSDGESFQSSVLVGLIKTLVGSKVTKETKKHKLGIRVRVGYMLIVSGVQNVTITKIKVGDVTITVKEYGSVEFSTAMYDRDHNGGTN